MTETSRRGQRCLNRFNGTGDDLCKRIDDRAQINEQQKDSEEQENVFPLDFHFSTLLIIIVFHPAENV